MWVFYIPIVIWIVILSIRYRSALLFTATNPAMHTSGLIDEDKASNLLSVQAQHPEFVAKTVLIPALAIDQAIELALGELKTTGLNYPIILKPNSGQRGVGVKVIRNQGELKNYFQQYPHKEILLQEHLSGFEYGVFYTREPNKPEGTIFSITEKSFPTLIGNGQSSIEYLILEDPRTNYMAEFLLELHKDQLDTVLREGEKIQLVEIGSHCRGSIFLEGSQHITAALTHSIDQLSKSINGYYFGRYDLRVSSVKDLRAGTNFKILEANGVSSESANIYDPSYGIFNAYRVMFQQWTLAFRIGKQNRDLGHKPSTFKEVLDSLRRLNKE